MKISVMNWGDYNPRKDLKHPTWFRMEHALMLSTKYLQLKAHDVVAWLYVLSVCSEANSGVVQTDEAHVAVFSRMSKHEFFNAVQKLQSLKLLRVECSDAERDLGAILPLRDDTERYDTDNISTGSSAPPPDPEVQLPLIKITKVQGAIIGDETLTEFAEIRESLRGRVKLKVQEKWLELYTAEFIIRKIKELDLWCLNNPHKAPRSNWSAFYSRCIGKDWEKYRQTLPSNKPGQQQQKSSWAIEKEKNNGSHAK